MVQETSQYVYDGQLEFSGGQDASKTPDRVPDNAVFSSVNTTYRNNVLGPRDGFSLITLKFPEGGVPIQGNFPLPYRRAFEEGKFQAIIPYSIGQEFYLIVVISGIVFLINQDTYEVNILNFPDGSMLNARASRINWSFASRFIVLFDYPSFPAIIENMTIRRANPANFEVPISTLGAYNQNRLFIANAGNEFTGGDPTGSLAAPDAPITFQEVEVVGSPFFGQIFQLPTSYYNNPITAMGFIGLIDSSTGIGPLIIATNNQIFAFNTQNPRSSWDDGPFGSNIVANAGIAGPRAFTNLNSDMFFLSQDGQIRSLSMSRDEQRRWSKSPISKEVKNWLKYHDRSLVKFGALTYFNNKIFTTVNPYRVTARTVTQEPIVDYVHGGMVALELDNISTLGSDAPPVWGGLWTGIRPMDFCINSDKCFVVSKDLDSINRIWEITPDLTIDRAEMKERYIRSTIYTRNYTFNDQFQNKELLYIDPIIENIQGDFKIDIQFKTSQAPNFLPWKIFEHKAPYRSCAMPLPCLNGLASHTFRELFLGSPATEACDPLTDTWYKIFRKVQMRFKIEGRNWELDSFKLGAVTLPQNITETVCEPYPTVAMCKECDEDWEIQDFNDCTPKET